MRLGNRERKAVAGAAALKIGWRFRARGVIFIWEFYRGLPAAEIEFTSCF
jgi:hypothetical protein